MRGWAIAVERVLRARELETPAWIPGAVVFHNTLEYTLVSVSSGCCIRVHCVVRHTLALCDKVAFGHEKFSSSPEHVR